MSKQPADFGGLFFLMGFCDGPTPSQNVNEGTESIPRLSPLRQHIRVGDLDAAFVHIDRATALQFLE